MKRTLITLSLLCIGLSCFGTERMESEFETRFKALIDKGNVSAEALKEVWLYEDTPTKQFMVTQGNFEATVSRGIGSFEIIDIFPMMIEGIKKPQKIEGDEYVINIAPYKMIKIGFEEKIKGGSKGWTYVLGEKEGKLYLVGLKKQIETK